MVYVAEHHGYVSVKIGIANEEVSTVHRLTQHTKENWDIIGVLNVDGDEAIRIESKILRWWRQELGLPHHLSPEQMPQGGFTETVSADAVSAKQVWDRVRKLNVSSSSSTKETAPETP
jgi:hypothetical protein